MFRFVYGLCIAATVFVGSSEVSSASIISGVTIHSVSSELRPASSGFDRRANYIIDGSGFVAGQHTSNPNSTMWDADTFDPPLTAGGATDTAPQIVFDLGAKYSISELLIWNYNAADFGGQVFRTRSVRTMDVYTSMDGVTFDILGQYTLGIAPGADGYLGETLDITDSTARYVRFDLLSNYSTDGLTHGIGLSEVRFVQNTAVPEPTTIAIWSLLGLCGVGYGLRRKTKKTF